MGLNWNEDIVCVYILKQTDRSDFSIPAFMLSWARKHFQSTELPNSFQGKYSHEVVIGKIWEEQHVHLYIKIISQAQSVTAKRLLCKETHQAK